MSSTESGNDSSDKPIDKASGEPLGGSATNLQPLRGLVRGSWEATAGERVRFFVFVLFYFIAYSLDLLSPWAIGYILGSFVQLGVSEQAGDRALLGLGCYVLLKFGHTLFHHAGRYVQSQVAYAARMQTLEKLFGVLMRFPLRWHISNHAGETLSRLNRSVGAIDGVIGTYLWQIIEGLVKLVFAGIAIFALDFWVAINVIVLSALTIGTMVAFHGKLTPRLRQNHRFSDRIHRISVDFLSNIVTVKTLSLEHSAQRYLKDRYEEGRDLNRSIAGYMELKWAATGIGYSLVVVSSLLIFFYRNQQQPTPFDVAQVYVLLNYLDRIYQAIGGFTGYYSAVLEAATAYEDAETMCQSAATLPINPPPEEAPAWGLVQLSKLNFRYESSDERGLKEIELELPRGQRVALVGASGSGKSTLLKVLGGMIVPDSICVEVQEPAALARSHVLHSVRLEELSQQVLLVPQEPEVFSETLRYNLAVGEEFSDEAIQQAIEVCRLGSVLERLPQGLESDLAQKGLNTSGGERQRIALARGVLRAKRKNFLLLDEPTSSLDAQTETEVVRRLLEAFSGKTIIAAVHRLNLLSFFDRIVVMKDGAIVESGTFTELLTLEQQFFRLWQEYRSKY